MSAPPSSRPVRRGGATSLRRALRRSARVASRCAALGLALLVARGAVSAHDFTILPGTFRPAAGAGFDLAMWVGAVFPGELVPWRTGRVTEFSITDARGRREIEAADLAGDPPRARLRLRNAGTAVVALATDASYITLEPAEFTAYLEEEGHETALAARRKSGATGAPGRERYTRHVKTVLNSAGPGASVALTRVGLALEIVPERDLSGLRPGGSLPVRIFFRNAPHANGAICASDTADPAAPAAAHDAGKAPGGGQGPYAWCGRLDGAGRAAVPVPRAGWQMLRSAKMVALNDDPKADWHSYWTSLTFEVTAPESGSPKGDP